MAQEKTPYADESIQVKRLTEPIEIDGEVNEKTWFSAGKAKKFWQNFPVDTIYAEYQTEIYMVYDDTHLYVGVICHAPSNDFVVSSLRRDFRAGGNDNITFLFDTFNDRTNAFMFGMNPAGVRREGLIANGGNVFNDFSTAWDNKWQGESKVFDTYWSAELKIPFKTLRFNEGTTEWGFGSYRFDTQSNERSTWLQIPRQQPIFGLAFMSPMVWEEPLPKSGGNFSLIPYLSGSSAQDFEAGETKPNNDFNVGLDAKVAVTSGLNLDLTVNPDFSQVEVDRQVTNLDRFEIFFPERRQFFLENADLFSNFGTRRINPFFSRRIGSATNQEDETIQTTISGGARLSGKLNNDWRLGLLNMQTAQDTENDLPSFNYTVAALQRKMFTRSNVGLIMVNKQTFEDLADTSRHDPFNRMVGLDYNLASADGKWRGKTFLHNAITADENAQGGKMAHGTSLNYVSRRLGIEWQHEVVGENYDLQVGFVPRTNFYRFQPDVQLRFFPENKQLNTHALGVRYNHWGRPDFGKTDHEIALYWEARFLNNSNLNMRLTNEYTYLFDDFDPTGTDSEPLLANTDYSYTNFRMNYSTNRNKALQARFRPFVGQYFNGWRYGFGGSLFYRMQPYANIELNYNINHIALPAPYATTTLFLIGPRIDLTFSKKLFLTTFVQYNSQAENMNINARLQWRYAPVSDFFIVYTDNYLTTDFTTKNRAVVAKWTYWLNL